MELLIAAFILGIAYVVRDYLPAYAKKKGENLATKEDIAKLTRLAEEVKAEIGQRSFERQTRFARLHERRAEILADTYTACVAAEEALHAVTDDGGWLQIDPTVDRKLEQFKEAVAAVNRFSAFDASAIFLPSSLLPPLYEMRSVMMACLKDTGRVIQLTRTPTSQLAGEDVFKLAREAFDRVRTRVPELRSTLEAAFRDELAGAAAEEQRPQPPASLPAPSDDVKDPV